MIVRLTAENTTLQRRIDSNASASDDPYKVAARKLAENIRELDITDAELADKAGLDRSVISRMRNARGIPSAASLEKIDACLAKLEVPVKDRSEWLTPLQHRPDGRGKRKP